MGLKVWTNRGWRSAGSVGGRFPDTVTMGDLYQGTIDCSGSPNYPAADKNMYWVVSVAGKIGGASGPDVEVGDTLVCKTATAAGIHSVVGANWILTQVSIDPSTVAELRTGTSDGVYVTPKTLKDQGITSAAATILALAGGSTEQLKLTCAAATKGLTVDASTTAHTGTKVVDVTLNVNSASVNAIDQTIAVATALSGSEIVKAFYSSLTSAAADADASGIYGTDIALVSTALSKADLVGHRVVISGTESAAAGTVSVYGFEVTPTVTLNSAVAGFRGVSVDCSGMTNTSSGSSYGLYINSAATTADMAYGIYGTSGTGTFGALDTANNDVVRLVPAAAKTGATIIADAEAANNAKFGISISKDLVNGAASGALANTNNALKIEAINTTLNLASGATTVGNNLVSIAESCTASVAVADVYSGKLVNLSYAATTDTTGTATNSAVLLNMAYVLTETAGTLTNTAFNVVGVEYNTAGTPDYGAGNYNFFNVVAVDASTPTYAATTYLSGYRADLSAIKVTDANLVLYGVNIVMPAVYGVAAECAAYFTGDNRTFRVLTDAAHIRAEETLITDMPVTAPGIGFNTAGGVLYVPHGRKGATGMVLEEIFIDLEIAAVSSKDTLNDIIGEAAGGAAYIGQITSAFNGTVTAIEVVCVEAPAGGDVDIDFYSADENTGVYDTDVTTLTEIQLINAGGNWTLGMVKAASALPGANQYLYLASGNGAVAGAYTAGKFIIRIYGT